MNIAIVGPSKGNLHLISFTAIINAIKENEIDEISKVFPSLKYLKNLGQHSSHLIDNSRITMALIYDKNICNANLYKRLFPSVKICESISDLENSCDYIIYAVDEVSRGRQALLRRMIRTGKDIFVDKHMGNSMDLDFIKNLANQKQRISCHSGYEYSSLIEMAAYKLKEFREEGVAAEIKVTIPKDWATYSPHVIRPMLKIMQKAGIQQDNCTLYQENSQRQKNISLTIDKFKFTCKTLGDPKMLEGIENCFNLQIKTQDTELNMREANSLEIFSRMLKTVLGSKDSIDWDKENRISNMICI